LFAGQRIAAKSPIIDYIGKISVNTQINCSRLFDKSMSLRRWPEGVSVGVDPSAMGNQARFVNDFRGAD